MTARQKPQVNSTSGIPGLRLRVRTTRTGLLRTFIEVQWNERGRRTGTSIPVERDGPVHATQRAMWLRRRHAGAEFDASPLAVWRRLVRGANRSEP